MDSSRSSRSILLVLKEKLLGEASCKSRELLRGGEWRREGGTLLFELPAWRFGTWQQAAIWWGERLRERARKPKVSEEVYLGLTSIQGETDIETDTETEKERLTQKGGQTHQTSLVVVCRDWASAGIHSKKEKYNISLKDELFCLLC